MVRPARENGDSFIGTQHLLTRSLARGERSCGASAGALWHHLSPSDCSDERCRGGRQAAL